MSDAAALAGPAAAFLAEAARDLGLGEADARCVRATGAEDFPSCFPVTDLAVASVGAVGIALADLLGNNGEAAVTVDRRLASAWFLYSLAPLGWSRPSPWDPIAGDYPTADGWIRLHTNAPRHREAALKALACAGERDAVATAVSRWKGEALEDAVFAAGGCAASMRSRAAWDAHPQGQAAAREPLIDIRQTGASSTRAWRPDPARPLRGVRVLDLKRVLAGPVATRTLAGLGADVLRIDPPDWDKPAIVPDVALGKCCARLDLRNNEDRRRFSRRLAEADVLAHGYRPGALEGLGFGEADRRRLNPGLIDVSLCAWGWSGPWSRRRGFDSLVQMASGVADAGMAWTHADRPTPLPAQALDHATGYFMAAAVLRGLSLRLRENTGAVARLSLARTAATLVGADNIRSDRQSFAAPSAADYSPESEPTPWGAARRLRPPLVVEDVTLRWDRPASALGSSPAEWM